MLEKMRKPAVEIWSNDRNVRAQINTYEYEKDHCWKAEKEPWNCRWRGHFLVWREEQLIAKTWRNLYTHTHRAGRDQDSAMWSQTTSKLCHYPQRWRYHGILPLLWILAPGIGDLNPARYFIVFGFHERGFHPDTLVARHREIFPQLCTWLKKYFPDV